MPAENEDALRLNGYREGEGSALEYEHAREMLRNAMTLTGLGIWSWNLTTLFVELSEEVFAIFRQDPAAFDGTVDYMFDHVLHPSARKAFSEVLHARLAHTALRARENLRLLDTLLGAMPNPVFFKDRQGIYQFCNDAFLEMIGVPREEVIGHTVHGVAGSTMARVYAQADADLMASGGSQMYESQIRSSTGVVRDVIFNKAVVKALDGTPLGIVGVVQDVTERKATERHLRMLHQVKDVMLRMNHGIFEYPDLSVFFGDLLARLLELYQDCAQGCVLEIVDTDSLRILRSIGYDTKASGDFRLKLQDSFNWQLTEGRMDRVVLIDDMDVVRQDARGEILLNARGEAIQSVLSIPVSDGEQVHWIISIDSTRKNRFRKEDRLVADYLCDEIPILIRMFHLHARTLSLSRTDPLTGLINRGYAEAILDDRIRTARRSGAALQVAMLDMDGLKRINDLHGHLTGDGYLLALARHLEQSIRSSDVLARIGGDEFLAVFSDTSRADAERILGNIRTSFAAQDVECRGITFRGSFSFGLASFPEDADNRDGLLHAADRRMYEDKGMRRDWRADQQTEDAGR